MKTLHLSVIAFLLIIVLFPFNTIFAQSEIQPNIEFDSVSYFTKKMNCNFYNTGKIYSQDQEQTKAIIIVTDPNANKFSTSIDRVTVYVWSDFDQKGIEITAYETEVNSGIFKGTVTISDGQSTQDMIHVSDGDTLSAKYASTTPWSLNAANQGISATAFIGMSCSPIERAPVSSIRVLDNQGNEHNVITVDQQVMITSDISNPTTTNQTFTYIVQIQDKNESTVSLAWLSGNMLPNQAFSPSISWTPTNVGNYVVNVFVWQSLINPNSLSPPMFAELTVLHDSSTYKKPVMENIENLHCKLGFELLINPSNDSPVCVTPTTASKLVERGWGTSNASSIDGTGNQEKNGTLSGVVSAYVYGGPLTTVSPNRSVHYEVDVYATDGTTIVGKTLSDANARYSIQLPSGNYIIYTYNNTKQTHLVSVYTDKNTVFNISSSIVVP